MVRADFDKNLEHLEAELLLLGEMVEKAIIKAMDALERRDLTMAYEVVAEDDLIDEKRFELEEKCIDLIATQQPLAVDLRTLLAVLHIAVELERMGDYAEGIGKICMIIGDDEPVATPKQLPEMAQMGIAMLRRSLKSLMDRDTDLANDVWDSDDEVDALYDGVCHQIFLDMGQHPKTIEAATHFLWVAHDLERIADRATNIAERVIFVVTGRIGRYKQPTEETG
ncbi:MAG: phosphate transport system regulatory protein PhoU [Chloroflexi bacterium]|jgi:phosphate transport system protein|nr:phosphate transport system regulatory protein PhoU [Chloroflexota bacterium]MBL16077.1 phosphate transport system regulatory protein PhoU [Chloroflexota bacterium]MDP6497094.1 phosphate signaling complex protein PhoU [Dehalococcoidia bacterium]MQG10920.1 phosphate signaling complex protein PhoU [SAR202 cluster bacterium]MQG54415.1 phosphate signaling complex protein PhoU [SAR202 cluster bacterium]|tara:strand:+ start:2204 stop:2878 length:675 start_codon:yes stop_codon:yes gene_type:complete